MTTAARVGIDIIAQDKTRAAFASASASMAAFNRSLNQIKIVMSGIAGGNLLAGFVRSMVSVNREVPAVKLALDQLNGAWILFARRVGDAGLNDALIGFAQKMAAMVMGTNSLGTSIGRFLAGAVNVMSGTFEVIGRSIAFVYDNMAALGRLLGAIGLVAFGRMLILVAGNMLLFYKSVAITAKGLLAFTAINRMGTAGFVVLAGVIGYATDTLDDMKRVIDEVWQKAKTVFPGMAEVATEALKDLGFDIDSLTDDFSVAFDSLKGLEKVGAPAAESLKKTSGALNGAGKAAKDASLYMMDFGKSVDPAAKVMDNLGSTLSSEFTQAFSAIADGSKSAKDAFSDMARSILNSVTNMALNNLFTSFLGGGMGGGRGGGGLLGSLFGGFRAGGGNVQAGKAYVVGEKRPEVFVPGVSGSIVPRVPMGGGSTVIIEDHRRNAPPVEQRQDGAGNIRLLIRDEVNGILASGQADQSMGARFGARPAMRR